MENENSAAPPYASRTVAEPGGDNGADAITDDGPLPSVERWQQPEDLCPYFEDEQGAIHILM